MSIKVVSPPIMLLGNIDEVLTVIPCRAGSDGQDMAMEVDKEKRGRGLNGQKLSTQGTVMVIT